LRDVRVVLRKSSGVFAAIADAYSFSFYRGKKLIEKNYFPTRAGFKKREAILSWYLTQYYSQELYFDEIDRAKREKRVRGRRPKPVKRYYEFIGYLEEPGKPPIRVTGQTERVSKTYISKTLNRPIEVDQLYFTLDKPVKIEKGKEKKAVTFTKKHLQPILEKFYKQARGVKKYRVRLLVGTNVNFAKKGQSLLLDSGKFSNQGYGIERSIEGLGDRARDIKDFLGDFYDQVHLKAKKYFKDTGDAEQYITGIFIENIVNW